MQNDRIAVLIAMAALLVAIAAAALSSGTSTADFVVDTVSPGNQVVTLDPEPPATFAAPDSEPGGAVLLSWTASATASVRPETTYSVHRSADGGGTWTQLTSGLSALTYTDTPPSDGSYDYKIRADVSSFHADTAAQAGLSDRTAPVVSDLTSQSGQLLGAATVELSWTTPADASGVAGYTLYWRTATLSCPAAPYANTVALGAVTSHTFSGSAATSYCFYLVATDGVGNIGANSSITGPKTAQ